MKSGPGKTFNMKIILYFLFFAFAFGKTYDRCELARELLVVHRAPRHQIPTWVCIAEHESQYMTHVVGNLSGDGSGDHGLFQINDRYWCSPPGKGEGCELSCSKLQDDDISDDFKCVQKIYKEHKKLQGDGFNAWAVYQPHCKGSKALKYVKDCFDDSFEPKLSYNEKIVDPSSEFFNGTRQKGNFAFSENATFDAFFTPKKSILSSTTYLSTRKPTTTKSNVEPKVQSFLNPFLLNSFQPILSTSKNTAIKFSNPSTKLYYSKITSTTPRYPYIDRLAFFNPTTKKPFTTISTVKTTPKFFASKARTFPTISTVKTFPTFSTSQFRTSSIPTNTIRTPSAYSSSNFRSISSFSAVRNPSIFPASSQFRAFPTVNTKNVPFSLSTSKFNLFPQINTVSVTSKKITSNFQPFFSTSTLRPTLTFETSKSLFVPSPTVSSFFTPTSTISAKTTARQPLFIFNGVKWY